MDAYTPICVLGESAHSIVIKAKHIQSGEMVAIKRLKRSFQDWNEVLQLSEIQSLRKLRGHLNVVKLNTVVKQKTTIALIFELMDSNLYEVMRHRQQKLGEASSNRAQMQTSPAFSENEIRSVICQILLGLQYVHSADFFHRNIQPENLLVGGDVVKLADFGVAKDRCMKPPYTNYIDARWYQAPELQLRSPSYGPAVDVWAVGTIMAELYLGRPLFPGSSDGDQLYKVFGVVGQPTRQSWPDGCQLLDQQGIRSAAPLGVTPLHEIIPSASEEAIQAMTSMLCCNPAQRPTVAECLQLPYFSQFVPHDSRAETVAENDRLQGMRSSRFCGIASGKPHDPYHDAEQYMKPPEVPRHAIPVA